MHYGWIKRLEEQRKLLGKMELGYIPVKEDLELAFPLLDDVEIEYLLRKPERIYERFEIND